MKQKAAIARSMLHDPPVLILDEATAGLDVPAARVVEAAVLEAKQAGKCVIYSTHIMEEAEYLCDRIGVIGGGKLCALGTMEELRERTGKRRLREVFLDMLGLPPEGVRTASRAPTKRNACMRIANIAAIMRKELLDLFRDRRSLISMLVVPLLVFPLLISGMVRSVPKARRRRQTGSAGACTAAALPRQ